MVMNQDESGTDTLEKHYRVTLDFKLLVREITSEVCQESDFFNDRSQGVGEADFIENVERQKRLYQLLRRDKEVLERYLHAVLTQDAGDIAYNKLVDAFNVRDESEFLVPLYQRMGEDDTQFFEECREVGALDANVELISRAFKVEWIRAEIAEMNRVVEGDIKRAEIVGQTKTHLIKKLNTPR
jgi:hypothetical protein